MFGYVRPCVPELKVKDNELYRATYCGLCRTMGKTTGAFSKVALNYDFVFLALLRMALGNDEVTVKMRRCPLHPFKKRPMIEPNETLKYSARTTTILTRLKLKDNVNDSHGFAKIKAKTAGAVSIFFKKTDKSLNELEEKICGCIDELSKFEKAGSDSLDMVSSTSGKLLANLASFGIDDPSSRILYEIGFHLGKLIYVLDAVDDYESDKKTGSFNVIKNAFETFDDSAKETLKCAMIFELQKMSRALELLDFTKCRDVEAIVKNITYVGLPEEIERVILGKKKSRIKI